MWEAWTKPFLKHLAARHLATATLDNYRRSLEDFAVVLNEDDPRQASLDNLLKWKARLARSGLALSTQNGKVRHLKAFYKWLHKTGRALTDPGKNLPVLRNPKTLPKNVPSAAQVVKLLRVPNTGTTVGIRDRAILELLYSSGLRAGELCKLTVYDLDAEGRTVRIIQGKGRKDRIVPVGRAALDWCRRYLKEVRPTFLPRRKPGRGETLFMSLFGNPMQTAYLYRIVKRCARVAGLAEGTTTHGLRHACATEMLKGGASVRHIQEMLGHADISTTQVYTHLAKADLQAVHAKTAPSERRKDKDAPAFTMTNWRPRKRKKPRRKPCRPRKQS
jgi:integrase/recombinase XerD